MAMDGDLTCRARHIADHLSHLWLINLVDNFGNTVLKTMLAFSANSEDDRSKPRSRSTLALLLFALTFLFMPAHGKPRYVRATREDPDYVTVTTKYGALRGRSYNISDSVDVHVFLGIPYAKPPVGERRFARPEPVAAWTPEVRNATEHGAKCVQRIIQGDPVLEGVPFSEDCLFLDIYTTRQARGGGALQPVMVYFHPGGYYGGSGAKYNFTNLAMKGVVVVSVSFRLDVFGYLSTQDDVIPGNFGLLDAALALDFIKETIGDFGGDAGDITLFGASSGAAMVSIFTLSPLTKGTFQKAIMQSGSALCPWAVFIPGRVTNVPATVAQNLAARLNCSLPGSGSGGANVSRDLLACLRAVPVDVLRQESEIMQLQDYNGDMVFIPVTGDAFGFLPETPEQLLAKPTELVAIPTLLGFSTSDGSWLVPDADDDGFTYREFQFLLNAYLYLRFPPGELAEISQRVMKAYLPSRAQSLAPVPLRTIFVEMMTDFSMAAFIIKQARLFAQAEAGGQVSSDRKPGTYLYQFNHRPSYSTAPFWHGVGHADEKGFVLGLTPGPDPFNYPNTTANDRYVADLVTTMWTNFAKFGDPTPQALHWPEGLRWPRFGHTPDDQDLLLIDVESRVTQFERNSSVVAWTGDSGLTSPNGYHRAQAGSLGLILSSVLILWKMIVS